MEDQWLSLRKIAESPGTRRGTIYKWIEGKGMPGHHYRKFKKDEVNAWIKSGKVGE